MNIFDETLVIVVESPNVGGVYSVNGKAGYVTLDKSDIGLSEDLVYLTGNQTISGVKTFITRPQVNGTGVLLSGEGGDVAILPDTIVYTTGNQIISGNKAFFDLSFYPLIQTGISINITQTDDSPTQTIDIISTGVQLTRGTYGVLYNPIFNVEGVNNPTNTRWNEDGWGNLSNIQNRTYKNLNLIGGGGNFGNAIIGNQLIMRDTSTNKYYQFLFSEWQQNAGQTEGYRGFSYRRNEISVSVPAVSGSGIRGNLDFLNRPSVNGTGILLIGEAGQVPQTVVQTSGAQTISGSKTFTASTLFTSNIQAQNIQAQNIQANNTGIFSDMQISANEMNVSGLDVTISSGNLVLSSPTGIPATTGAFGIKGSFVWDSGFLYICTNTNSWKRVALNTW